MRTWKIDGPPEIVDGIVMNVMTSCSLRPARRMTASEIGRAVPLPPAGVAVAVVLLIDSFQNKLCSWPSPDATKSPPPRVAKEFNREPTLSPDLDVSTGIQSVKSPMKSSLPCCFQTCGRASDRTRIRRLDL